jgi:hypothetical protein
VLRFVDPAGAVHQRSESVTDHAQAVDRVIQLLQPLVQLEHASVSTSAHTSRYSAARTPSSSAAVLAKTQPTCAVEAVKVCSGPGCRWILFATAMRMVLRQVS